MGTRADSAELRADPRGNEDAAQRRQGQKAPHGREARAGAQGAGRGPPAWDARAPPRARFPPRPCGGGARCGPAHARRLRPVSSD